MVYLEKWREAFERHGQRIGRTTIECLPSLASENRTAVKILIDAELPTVITFKCTSEGASEFHVSNRIIKSVRNRCVKKFLGDGVQVDRKRDGGIGPKLNGDFVVFWRGS